MDTYLVPHAAMELGLTHLSMDNFAESKYWLEKAKRDYSGYLLETIVHFRVHCAMRIIRSKQAELLNSNSSTSTSTSTSTTPEQSPLTSPQVDVVAECDGVNSTENKFSSMFIELSKKMQQFTLANKKTQSNPAIYEDFTDSYQTK